MILAHLEIVVAVLGEKGGAPKIHRAGRVGATVPTKVGT